MGKNRAEKDRATKQNAKKRKLGLKTKNNKKTPTATPNPPIEDHDPILFSDPNLKPEFDSYSDSDSDSPRSPDCLQRLLDPHTKDQLISFLLDVIPLDPSLLPRIKELADRDVSHRKLFVHGLAWDATRDTLLQAFTPFGSVEDCNVVVDKVTGRAKGYGFVLFKTRAGALKALKEPQKKIKNRAVTCQLASVGPPSPAVGAAAAVGDTTGRRIYVSNVHADAAPDRLRTLFARFGELESGPGGFDQNTGKSRGYAIFVYKTQEAARRALEEPYKMFEGHQLHCQYATDSSQKGKAVVQSVNPPVPAAAASAGGTGVAAAVQQPMLAAVVAAQNLALLGQNPAYGALLAQNPLLAAAAFNQTAGMLNPAAMVALNPSLGQSLAQGLGGSQGLIGGAPSLLGPYGSHATTAAGMQALQALQGTQQHGQPTDGRQAGLLGGFPFVW